MPGSMNSDVPRFEDFPFDPPRQRRKSIGYYSWVDIETPRKEPRSTTSERAHLREPFSQESSS